MDRTTRKALNFGHTLGHAMESISLTDDNPLLHGEAIAAGIIMEAHLSFQILNFPRNILDRLTTMISGIFPLKPVTVWSFEEIESLVSQDKKALKGITGFTLLRKPGDFVTEVACSIPELRKAVGYFNTMAR
jgi:3-dehydroquinate synthase